MKRLFVDLETYSSVDITKCGAYKYVESDDFEILLTGYAFDNGPVTVIDMTKDKLPGEFTEAMYDQDVVKIAWNAAFERTCFTKYFGIYTDPSQWFDPMILSASCGLPLALAQAGEALGLGEDQAKLKTGKALIKYFCGPVAPSKTNGGRTRNMPEHAPDKWETFIDYNRRDVEVERTIHNRLLKWRPDRVEQKFWCLDQRINDRGMRVDTDLACKVVDMCGRYKDGLLAEAIEISGIANPDSAKQVKDWLLEQEGIEAVSLNKKAVADVVSNLKTEECKRFMELRSEFSQSSISKYDSAIRCTGNDGHIHGCFQFYGASTGRFSGRLMQLQNLSHDTIEDLDAARALAKIGDYEDFKAVYPNVQYVAKCLIRTLLIPEENSRFIVADFSAIEARVIAWIAGEQWRIDTFKNNGDIYCASASQAFKVPVVKHGENGHLRAKGKVLELACVAEGALILTDVGLVPIQNVSTKMKLWDGDRFVSHGGLINRGRRDTIYVDGIEMTPDHKIYTSKGVVEAGESAGLDWEKVRLPNCVETYGKQFTWANSLGVSVCLWKEESHTGEVFEKRNEVMRMYAQRKAPNKAWNGIQQALQCMASYETALSKFEYRLLEILWGKRNTSVRSVVKQLRKFSIGYGEFISRRIGIRSDSYEWGLFRRKLPLGNKENKCQKQKKQQTCRSARKKIYRIGNSRTNRNKVFNSVFEMDEKPSSISIRDGRRKVPVYDILNSGKNHRFCVYDPTKQAFRLVHNCGYGGGIGALKNFGADKLMKEDEMAELIVKWREASPNIVKLWKSMETAAIRCVKTGMHQDVVCARPVSFDMEDGVLFMTLPSGRRIAYWGAQMGKDKWGRPSLTYQTLTMKHKFERVETFGGKLTENCIQSVARDVLREAMFHLDAAGYDIRGHVHDEIIMTVPNGKGSLDEAIALMCKGAKWTEGLPLNADGYENSVSYRKD